MPLSLRCKSGVFSVGLSSDGCSDVYVCVCRRESMMWTSDLGMIVRVYQCKKAHCLVNGEHHPKWSHNAGARYSARKRQRVPMRQSSVTSTWDNKPFVAWTKSDLVKCKKIKYVLDFARCKKLRTKTVFDLVFVKGQNWEQDLITIVEKNQIFFLNTLLRNNVILAVRQK